MKLVKKPLFWTNVLTLSVTGVMVAGLAFGWTNPKETPPDGSGEVSVTSDRKVGVGTLIPTQKLDINGYLVGRTGFCLGKDDLTAAPVAGLTSLSTATLTGTHSTTDSKARVLPAGVVHDIIVSADYSAISTLRSTSESSAVTLRDAATASGLTTAVSTSGGTVSTTAYKAVGCRTTWPAPGVGIEKSEAEAVSSSGISGFSVIKKPIATYGTPTGQYVNKNRLAKFVTDTPGQETIGNSNVYDDGKTVSVTGDFSISGTWIGGKIPWFYLTNIPKVDCGAGKVLQGINPTVCATAAGAPAPVPAAPASCTSTVTSSSMGLPTAICGLSCSSAHITSYTGAGTPFMSAIPNPPPSTGTTYICNGKPSPGTSSITCSC
ncbi:MAG: hypothetical protein AAB389_03315 [Patescibacteria group bacterium]